MVVTSSIHTNKILATHKKRKKERESLNIKKKKKNWTSAKLNLMISRRNIKVSFEEINFIFWYEARE